MARNLGIDIGSSSIKIVEVDSNGVVERQGVYSNPTGKNISIMTNTERIALTDVIRKGLQELGVKSKSALVSIPESLTYSKVMKFPKMSTPELATAIKWEVDQSVPFPPNEIEMSWALMPNLSSVQSEQMFSYVVAVPGKVSETYVQLFDLLELEIVRLENESPSLQRSASSFVPSGGHGMLLNMGYSGTNILLCSADAIVSSYYFSVGGNAITKLVSDTFGITADQAENYKRTYGLLSDQLDGKMLTALKPVFDNLVLEMKKMLIAFKNDFGEMKEFRILLSGGGSYTPGLSSYISTAMGGVEVSLANVFEGHVSDQSVAPYGPIHVVSYGLTK